MALHANTLALLWGLNLWEWGRLWWWMGIGCDKKCVPTPFTWGRERMLYSFKRITWRWSCANTGIGTVPCVLINIHRHELIPLTWIVRFQIIDLLLASSAFLFKVFQGFLLTWGLVSTAPTVGRVSSVGIVTRYWLDGPGIESRWEARFSAPVQTCPGTHPASYTMGTGCSSGVKRPGCGFYHPPHLAPRLKQE